MPTANDRYRLINGINTLGDLKICGAGKLKVRP